MEQKFWRNKEHTFHATTLSMSLPVFEIVESDFYAASPYHAPRNFGLILRALVICKKALEAGIPDFEI
jgi:hypothetical protein